MLSIGRSVTHELGVCSAIGRFDSPACIQTSKNNTKQKFSKRKIPLFRKQIMKLTWPWERPKLKSKKDKKVIGMSLVRQSLFEVMFPYTIFHKYAQGFVVFWFVLVLFSVLEDSWDIFTHVLRGCVTGTGAVKWMIALVPISYHKWYD